MNQKKGIEKKIIYSFYKVSAITAIAAILGLISLIVISNRYAYALKNFGFAQGDIGKAMFEFADLRSSLRAAIGYDDADAIAEVVAQHNEGKVLFQEYFAKIEDTIVSEDGRKTYNAIKSELNTYWALDTQIMELVATTDRELCRQAQEIELNDLAPVYNNIYAQLQELLNVKVDQGNILSVVLITAQVVMAVIVAAVAAKLIQIGQTDKLLRVFVFFRQCGVYGFAALGHKCAGVESSFSGEYGFMYRNVDCRRRYVVGVACHCLERAVYRDRHHREPEFGGKHKCSAFERNHLSVPRPAAFRENDHRHTVLQCLFRFFYSFFYAVYLGVVNKYVSCGLAGTANQRDVFEFLFHQPFEVMVEIAVDGPNVKGTLVVGHKDI